MAQDTSNETAKKLLESVSFELDTDLRLHPKMLELGKAELLTDALTLPFTDIESRLNKYLVGVSEGEKLMLQKSMKSYLAKLNSNPLIPLNFRLKVLSRFEQELDLFDAEMTAAVLNAHKIGVDMVQKAARSEPSYYRIVVDMVSSALELAVKMLRIGLEAYQSPAVITTRQAFDLMRLGLAVAPAISGEATSERARLAKVVCNHEFLRMLDFFGKSKAEQRMVWLELQNHVGTLEPHYCRKGEAPPALKGESFVVTNTSKPNDHAAVTSKLPDQFAVDSIVVPVDHFIDRLVLAINRVESVLHNEGMQKNDLHTEEALHTTITGGNAILQALRTRERTFDRQDYAGTRVVIEWDAAKALVEAFSAIVLNEYEYAPSERLTRHAWSVVNINQKGVGMEQIGEVDPRTTGVGTLIGLSWIPHKNEPMLGIVRWIREPKPGERRMGIEFFRHKFKLYKGALIGGKSDEMKGQRSWPVLVQASQANQANQSSHTALFPDNRIYRNMVFLLAHDGKSAHFKVSKVRESGPNYCVCDIVAAKELKAAGTIDFS